MIEYGKISNNQVKKYSKLKQKKFRNEYNLFLVEGKKQCYELLKSNYTYEAVIINKVHSIETSALIDSIDSKNILLASDEEMKRIASADSPQDIIIIANISDVKLAHNENFVCLESISDPGNLGTIIRTCLWFGIHNILLSEDSVDIYNPKTVRSTMGAIFNINIEYTDDIIEYVNKFYSNHSLLGASLKADKQISEIEIPNKFGLFFGNESKGLSDNLENNLDIKYIISGCGEMESLNLSVSAGISLYHFCKV